MNFISILNEMAAAHFDDNIADFMVSGEVEKAVDKYIKNMQDKKATLAQTSGATTKKIKAGTYVKSLNMNKNKLDKIPKERWDEFDNVYKKKVEELGLKKTRAGNSRKIKGQEIKTKSGETITMTSGQSQKWIRDSLGMTVAKIKLEKENELKKAEHPATKSRLKEEIAGLEIMLDSLEISNRKIMIPGADPEKLKERYDKITKAMKKKMSENEELYFDDTINEGLMIIDAINTSIIDAKTKMAKVPNEEKRMYQDYVRQLQALRDKYAKSNVAKISSTDNKLKESTSQDNLINKAVREFKKLLKAVEDEREKNKILKNIEFLNLMKKAPLMEKVEIPVDEKMSLIMEAENYKGYNFAENYLFSAFIRAFAQDKGEYGKELTEEIYEIIYGEGVNELLDKIDDDKLLEAVKNENSSLLFEGYSSINNELTESVWEAIKNFGGKYLGRIKEFVAKGLPWAKDLLKKGIGFFTGNNIASIVVPSIAIAGGVAAGVALINKLRKKAKKNKLSKEEIEEFKETAKKQKNVIKKYV